MSKTISSFPIRIVGVPIDLGQNRRGVDMGPSAIRYAGLQERLQRLGWQVIDGGNVSAPNVEEVRDDGVIEGGRAFHAAAIAQVCRDVHTSMLEIIQADEIAIFLGGDHSISLGTVSAAITRAENVGVLWIDAHGDFNTPRTTPSGNVHGMIVNLLMGGGPELLTIGEKCLRPDQIVMIAVRDLDSEERVMLRERGVKIFTMRDIDERGMAQVIRDALYVLRGVSAIHISFDMDSLDPNEAPGVGTPVPGGLTYREAHLLMETLADDGRVRSLDIVEINPILDRGNLTAEVAVGLAASLFGQQII
jgi:arginase